MLYEIHMLKNYPSTNLNRDDSGSPKTCVFGGVPRGRISSQCLKRTWRTSGLFHELVGNENFGIRTRGLPGIVGEKLRERGMAENDIEKWMAVVSKIGVKEDKKKDGKENKKNKKEDTTQTPQIIFYAPEDIERIADVVEECVHSGVKPDTKALKEVEKDVKSRSVTLDIALFGRMVTSDAFRNVEASMQVAHAISTNRIVMESDFFTTMDDLMSGDTLESKGAGILDDTDYNSACYYFYASLDSEALTANLENVEDREALVKTAIPALIRTMAMTNPSGKQNSFAGHVLPSAVLIECKEKKIPVSLVNAYAEPAKAVGKQDLVENSIRKLVEECDMTTRNYGIPVEKRLWFCVDKYPVEAPVDAQVCGNFGDLLDAVSDTLK